MVAYLMTKTNKDKHQEKTIYTNKWHIPKEEKYQKKTNTKTDS